MSKRDALNSSAEYVEPGSVPLPLANLPQCDEIQKDTNPNKIIDDWIQLFNYAVSNLGAISTSDLFIDQCFWRDHLCMTWDLRTFHAREKIAPLLKHGCRIKEVTLDQSSELGSPTDTTLDGKLQIVQSFLKVETEVGRGAGVVRLVYDEGSWRCLTLYTFLEELGGHQEPTAQQRPFYLEETSRKEASHDEVEVLVLGAGQAGLAIAARLKMLGVDTLIVEKNPRVGNNWLDRYAKLVLHDPVWFDHMPYLPFPSFWPVYTPKEKLADWLESYAKILDLPVWTETTITSATWDNASAKWSLEVQRSGTPAPLRMQAKHIVQATGASGEPNMPQDISGMADFKGYLVHSTQFLGASPSHGKGKKAIVVGCCNSGHDIAQNLHSNGYHVTMIQRSSTLVIGAATAAKSLAPLFAEASPPTEDADTLFHSIPNSVFKRVNVEATVEFAKDDAAILGDLEAKGFKLDNGPADSGLWIKYLTRGGGYYIDTGCSKLIASGAIALESGVSVASITSHGMILSDGTKLEADEIILATGYKNMRTQTRKFFSDELADQMGDVWGFDEEGEIRGLWRPNGHPGFWFMGGNLALCRWFSRLLALQILAGLRGIKKDGDI